MSVSNADLFQDDSSEAGSSAESRESHGDRAAEPASSNSVVTECDLPDAPEKVWRALTVPKLLADWLPEAVESEILEAQPNTLLRYRWAGGEQDKDAAGRPLESVVTFELTGTDGGGTHLRVVHRPLVEEPATVVVNATVAAIGVAVMAVDHAGTAEDKAAMVVDKRVVCLTPRIRAGGKRPVAIACVPTLMRRAA
jgi:uncharacterized protein YndB with AHSA1/START domain